MKPAIIGTINGYVTCPCIVGRRRLTFDGTMKGLVKTALANGLRPGDGRVLKASFGDRMRRYRLYEAPWDDRIPGYWAERF